MNAWFRMYAEWLDDEEVQMMSEVMQRRLVALFCLRCMKRTETLQETQIAFRLRIPPSELAVTKNIFMKSGFIDEKWCVLNWNKRQFISDSSTDRVRKHRQAVKQDETFQKRDETENETPPDTDTDTEQNHKEPFALSEKSLPAVGTLPCLSGSWPFTQKDLDGWAEAYPAVTVVDELRRAREWLKANPKRRKTKNGMPRYVNSWLSREQNKFRPNEGVSNGKYETNNQRIIREALGSLDDSEAGATR